MSYREAIAATGATVREFEEFGSYQGDWLAKVELQDGRVGWVRGSYGSCSGCDAFQAEFGYGNEGWCDEHDYRPKEDCSLCIAAKAEYTSKLASFGAGYLDNLLSQEAVVASVSESLSWDLDAEKMLAFVQRHAI